MKFCRGGDGYENPIDTIELRGLNQSIQWGELDRWSYTDVATPPPYTLYTFLTLKEAFQVFLIMGAHTLLMLIIKMATSTQFRTKTNLVGKFIYVIQSLRDVLRKKTKLFIELYHFFHF